MTLLLPLVRPGRPSARPALALQRRHLFVGMTRARDRLTLLSGGEPAEGVRRAQRAMEVLKY